MTKACRYCGEAGAYICRSTRDMEDSTQSKRCYAALMFVGGGEYTANRLQSEALWHLHATRARKRLGDLPQQSDRS